MKKASDERTGRTEMTQEELDQFREFFTTSVAQVPEEMTGRVPEKAPKISGGLFQRLFRKKEEGSPAGGDAGGLALPTGEMLLDEDDGMVLEPVEPADALALEEAEELELPQELVLEPVQEQEPVPESVQPPREETPQEPALKPVQEPELILEPVQPPREETPQEPVLKPVQEPAAAADAPAAAQEKPAMEERKAAAAAQAGPAVRQASAVEKGPAVEKVRVVEEAPAAPAWNGVPKPKKYAEPVSEDRGLLELKELLDAMQNGRQGRAAKPAAAQEPEKPAVRPFIAGLEALQPAPKPEPQAAPIAPQPAPKPEPQAAQTEPQLQPGPAPQAAPRPEAPIVRDEPQPGPRAAQAAPKQELTPEPAAPAPEQPAVQAGPQADKPGDTIEYPAPPAEKKKPADAVPPAAPAGQPQEPPRKEPSDKERWDRLFQMFGTGEDEAPAPEEKPQEEDTMSLPLVGVEEMPGEAGEPEQAAEQPQAGAQAEPAEQPEPEAGSEEDQPQGSEEIGQNLKHMNARLTLRCALSGILAAALVCLGLMAEGLLPATGALDPVGAPVAFMGANLLLLLLAGGVSFGMVREGLAGLFGRPTADSLPAVAVAAALVQAVAALMNAETYCTSGLTLMSGMAALLLFLCNLGGRIRLAAIESNYEMISSGVEHSGAYRVRDRDLVRCLAEGLDEKDPWILLSRPVEWTSNFIEQSFSERASERMLRRMARILAVAGVLSGAVLLILGRGVAGAASAMAAMVCLGAPLSATLVAGLSSLRMQRTAGTVGAVIPGWAAVEELGGIDTVQVDARDLFTPECAQLEDIRMFKGGRIDTAILYTASVLNQGCNTLSGLFRQIIAERTDLLLPVKDLEKHRGLGFSGWCDNCRVLVGTREMMEREDVAVPEKEYEDRHSRNGELQILYLAVSGNLHAMFVLKYAGGRHAARGLSILQRENVRLLVSCDDPTLTARRISEVYRLPEGLVRVMTEEQCQAVAPAVAYASDAPCCMVHLQGFASLTGGLRAAARAQTAEQSGTTVQLVSVCISVVIGLLLTYAGNVGALSLVAVLMYQAAWSALSLAFTVMKQH